MCRVISVLYGMCCLHDTGRIECALHCKSSADTLGYPSHLCSALWSIADHLPHMSVTHGALVEVRALTESCIPLLL